MHSPAVALPQQPRGRPPREKRYNVGEFYHAKEDSPEQFFSSSAVAPDNPEEVFWPVLTAPARLPGLLEQAMLSSPARWG